MTQCKPKIIETKRSSFSCIPLALGGTFGEPFVDERTTDHDIRFKFTGKERDSEIKPLGADSRTPQKNEKGGEQTGIDYFGARYYSSGLSVWLSVDPLADKYPSTSPFLYVENIIISRTQSSK